jgi:peroxiredoxin
MFLWLGQMQGQTFAEALQAGQTIRVESIQQELLDERGGLAKDIPLFPDQLRPGESEIRVGLRLKAESGGSLVAEVDYATFFALPELDENSYRSNQENILSPPTILDTRFQDSYFNPQLFRLDVLTQENLPVSCSKEPYQQFLRQFEGKVEQAAGAAPLTPGQLEWLEQTPLSAALSASNLAAFFCRLLNAEVPDGESPMKIQTRKLDGVNRVDYLRVDHPPRMSVLSGTIQSPATEEVRIQFFREVNWLEYWQDTVIQLNGEGGFHLAFPLDNYRMVSLFHGYQTMRYYFEPGDSIHIRTNANAFYRDMQINGTARADNEFLLDFYQEMRGDTLYRSYNLDLLDKDPDAFFQEVRREEARELAFLARRAPTLRSGFAAWMDRIVRLEHATTQWEGAYRFMVEKGIMLAPDQLRYLQELSTLLYRLPQGKHFDFEVEEYLAFQFYLLQHVYQAPRFASPEDFTIAQLLPSRETFVRHTVMQLFRRYTDNGQLTESSQEQLDQLLAIARDSQLIREMVVFREGGRPLPPDFGYRTLQTGTLAPAWSYQDKEGVKVGLADFAGKKVLLHIGWVDNLDIALTDIQSFRQAQEQLPEIVHLLAAPDKDQFLRSVAGKEGLFIFVPPDEMDTLREDYRVDNRSNHYFLIGEDGNILANHYDLGTASKLRGTWEKIADRPEDAAWTPAQWLRFWRSLGIGALLLLLISGVVLWQRRIATQRDQRRRQLLETELRGIRSQMNPHFLFNAMSSIQNLIRKDEQEKADQYLGQFAGLMRKTLRNTSEEYIPLTDEIETLEHYCSLESLRQPFRYDFRIDERIDAHNTYIPGMILQPVIENAIIHGLAPQTGDRELVVTIAPGQQGLNCSVTDTGIGVLASRRHPAGAGHQSVGVALIRQRLELMGLKGEEHLTITDRSTLDPPAQGTVVLITIPTEQ